MGRAPCCDKANVKRGPWSPEEDTRLKSHIEQHGTGGNWIALPQKIGLKRCGKSCRLRWLNYLRPNIKHGGFTEDEDNLICSLYITIGSRWSIIAAQLPGRTDNDIKNYWNTRLKKKLLGRQRKENQARRDLNFANKQLENTKKEFYENYSINTFSGLYPQPPQLSEGYTSQESQSNCIDDISFMPPFTYTNDHHTQPKDESFDNTVSRLLNSPYSFEANGFDEIPEEIIYNNMPQMESFSALDLVNSNTTTSVSQESSTTGWGDVNSLIYPPGVVNNVHEFCQPRMAQQEYWTYFGEPSLPGY